MVISDRNLVKNGKILHITFLKFRPYQEGNFRKIEFWQNFAWVFGKFCLSFEKKWVLVRLSFEKSAKKKPVYPKRKSACTRQEAENWYIIAYRSEIDTIFY